MALDLQKLKPVDDTSAEIEAALGRIEAARGEAEAALVKAKADRERLLIEGSQKEVRAAEQAAHDAALDIERIGLLEAKIEPTLEPARERERQAEHDAKVAALETDIAKNSAFWDKDLTTLVHRIQAVAADRHALAERAQVLGLRDRANELRLGTAWTPPTNDTLRREQAEHEERSRRERNAAEAEAREARLRHWREQSEAVAKRDREREQEQRRAPAVIHIRGHNGVVPVR